MFKHFNIRVVTILIMISILFVGCSKSPTPIVSPTGGENSNDKLSKRDLFAKICLLEKYDYASLINVLGKGSRTTKYSEYKYPDGISFTCDYLNASSNMVTLGEEFRNIYFSDIKKRKCDIFVNPGDELLFFYKMNGYYKLMVIDSSTKQVLNIYETNFSDVYEFDIGDFFNDGTVQLYIKGFSETDNETFRFFRFSGTELVRFFDNETFHKYIRHISTVFADNKYSLMIKNASKYDVIDSFLPYKLIKNIGSSIISGSNIYDEYEADDLSVTNEYFDILLKNGSWYFSVKYSFAISTPYFYGESKIILEDKYSELNNKLAIVSLLLIPYKEGLKIIEKKASMKYENSSYLSTKSFNFSDCNLSNGVGLGMDIKKGYLVQRLNPSMYDFDESPEIDGVSISQFSGNISNIFICNPNIKTPRGLHVGLRVSDVESLYGKPDLSNFPEDLVVYVSTVKDKFGETFDEKYYLVIKYDKGVVKSFELIEYNYEEYEDSGC